MLVYGMGEQPLREVLGLLSKGVPFDRIDAVLVDQKTEKIPVIKDWEDVTINSHTACLGDKKTFASNFKVIEQESNKLKARRILQEVDEKTLVINPPFPIMTEHAN